MPPQKGAENEKFRKQSLVKHVDTYVRVSILGPNYGAFLSLSLPPIVSYIQRDINQSTNPKHFTGYPFL